MALALDNGNVPGSPEGGIYDEPTIEPVKPITEFFRPNELRPERPYEFKFSEEDVACFTGFVGINERDPSEGIGCLRIF